MTPTVTEAMFSLTPPPSEFDEVDRGQLLGCSPSLASFTYPSPAPSHSGRVSLSEPAHSSQDGMPFPDLSQSHSHDLYFGDQQHDPSFMPIPTLAGQVAQFQPQAYGLFQQHPWMALSYQAAVSSYEPPPPPPPPSSTFPALETPIPPPPSYANVIPPTPQDLGPVSFDLSSLPRTTPSHRGLSVSSSLSMQSRRCSTLSRSRSPSPMPLQVAGGGGGDAGTRPVIQQTLRSNSLSSVSSLHAYGIPVTESSSGASQAAWRCAYPGCTSRATFSRGCDLRKHYNRHSKHLFCRVDGCPQSQAAALSRCRDGILSGGFSSKKDRARHEAKHNPGIKCEWRGPNGEECGRIFSRMDNMKDHVRRIHKKQEQKSQIS